MGLIHKVIDVYAGGVTWHRGGWWGESTQQVCIMGAVGLVLQPENVMAVAYPHYYTPEEREEIRTFLDVICEQYEHFNIDVQGRIHDHYLLDDDGRLSFEDVVEEIITWNDNWAQTFEDDIQPMLEKTALRISEKVT